MIIFYRVLDEIRDTLSSYGINVIFEEIRILENSLWPAAMAENTHSEKRHSPNADILNGSLVTMDELTIIPADNVIVMSENEMVITEVDDTSSTNPATFDKMELTNKFKDDNHATEVQEELKSESTKLVSFHYWMKIMQLTNPKTYQISKNSYQNLQSYR